MVRERHADGRIEEAHVFDRWWHVGTAGDADELAALAETRAEIGFDPDVYKILQGHFRKRMASVQELAAPSYLDLEAAE
jgi:DNA polymerase-3 subunit epsilon